MNLNCKRTITKTSINVYELDVDDIEALLTENFRNTFPKGDISIAWGCGQNPSVTVKIVDTEVEGV